MSMWRHFWRDCSGASTAEFMMAVPVLLLFIFGTIDVAGFALKLNRLEKATQMGTRLAVVTDPVASGLKTETYLGRLVNPSDPNSGTLAQGQIIPAAALGLITCTSGSSCTCSIAPCITDMSASASAYALIVSRMAAIDSSIGTANGPSVTVEYRGSGLGYAGDPAGMEIAPLVTVRLTSASYKPIIGMLLGRNIPLPDFNYSLTMEDGSGSASN